MKETIIRIIQFDNGHKATIVKTTPKQLYKLTSTCPFIKGDNLTSLGVEILISDLKCLGERK